MMRARANGLPAKQTNTAVIDRSATIRAQKVPELMASDVRRRIMRGDLRDGDSLPPEAELMAQYNVSRPSLREALRILESDALIVVRRGGHGGAVVRRPTMEVTARHFGLSLQERGAHVEDVYHARTVLEPPAIAEVARNATSAQIAQLTQKLGEVDAFVGSPARYAHAISEFREFMIGLTGNITVSLLVRLIDEVLERHQAQTGDARGEAWVAQQRKSQRSVRKLLALIEARDAEGAEEFWRKHLREAARQLFVDGKGASVIDLLG